MPIFEYGCDSCEALIERLESRSDVELPPICCNTSMRKLISTQLHILKGTGFYATDHGLKQHHLEPQDQARRAAKECKEKGIIAARPQCPKPDYAEKLYQRVRAGS